ncbi:putative D-serine ammonia-lyase [Microsporum canis]
MTSNAEAAELKALYVGRMLQDIDGPKPVIDREVARRNCQVMLDTVAALEVDFRAHVKTHKTTELTRFQVGEKSDTVRLVASTLLEAEQLIPFLKECQTKGRKVDLIYGLPIQPSCFPRLAELGKTLGHGAVTCLVDSIEIIPYLSRYHALCGKRLGVFVKMDTGYGRAGVAYNSPQFDAIVSELYTVEGKEPHLFTLRGFYSHMGHSYSSDHPSDAMDYLRTEIEGCKLAADRASAIPPPIPFDGETNYSQRRFILSVGATPSATAAQNLTESQTLSLPGADKTKALIDQTKQRYDVELHAGAYVTLDMQQLAARARPYSSHLSFDDLALTVLAEVGSLYMHREHPEALVACGLLAVGREPCRSYSGWGVVTPWREQAATDEEVGFYDPDGNRTGWVLDRISQEHGILRWHGSRENMRPLRIGEKLRIWPNHCCICCAGFSHLLVVDSTAQGSEKDRIVDVWQSWRGW